MIKARRYVVTAALLLAVGVAAPAWAQTPDLSGTWKFDASQEHGRSGRAAYL